MPVHPFTWSQACTPTCWDWCITCNTWVVPFLILCWHCKKSLMNCSWQSYFAQIEHTVENVDHAHIFQIQKKRNYLNHFHKDHQGDHHHEHLGCHGTSISTRSMGKMSTITEAISWTSISISTISSWWVRRVMLFTWGVWLLTLIVVDTWYWLSRKEVLWEISLPPNTACSMNISTLQRLIIKIHILFICMICLINYRSRQSYYQSYLNISSSIIYLRYIFWMIFISITSTISSSLLIFQHWTNVLQAMIFGLTCRVHFGKWACSWLVISNATILTRHMWFLYTTHLK